MKSTSNFPGLLEGFFTQRLLQQKQAHTPLLRIVIRFDFCSGLPRNACTNHPLG